jgi:hypothetical protein
MQMHLNLIIKFDKTSQMHNLKIKRTSYLSLDLELPDLTNKSFHFLPLQEYKFDALTYEHDLFRVRDRFKNDSRSYFESYAIPIGEDGKAAPLVELSSLGRNRVLGKKEGVGFDIFEGAAQGSWGVARDFEASQAGLIAAKITAVLSWDGERAVRGAVVWNAEMLFWLASDVQAKSLCLATYPLVATQDFGYSDTEKKNVDYGFIQRRFENNTAGFGTK